MSTAERRPVPDSERSLDFEIAAAQEVYDYLMERSDHIEGINAEVFAVRCVERAFGKFVVKKLSR